MAKYKQQTLIEETRDSLAERSTLYQTWHTQPPDVSRQLRALPSGRGSNSLVRTPQPMAASSLGLGDLRRHAPLENLSPPVFELKHLSSTEMTR